MRVGARAWVAAALVAAVAPAAQGSGAAGYAQRYAAVCAACHGAQGTSAQADTPHLGGQPSFYAITQLFLFRDGRRNDHPMSAAMSAVAKGMSDADLRGFADFIATLPPPQPAAAGGDAAAVERGRALAQRHHCLACHGADLAGGKQVPRIGGQREDYLKIALRGFKSGVRLGYTKAMGEALSGLSTQDLDDLASYLARPGP